MERKFWLGVGVGGFLALAAFAGLEFISCIPEGTCFTRRSPSVKPETAIDYESCLLTGGEAANGSSEEAPRCCIGGQCFWKEAGKSVEDPVGCEITNCHGLEITCGSVPPDFCTMLYQSGDVCRPLARCEVINGRCQLVGDPRLTACWECVRQCQQITDQIKSINCESSCRLE
ncbi:MAG: hypothetical protein JW991_03905 [Candidatus Pacebacteria bacterium]|nr:hypothetical protein [Candidatus Paceibacterota bacterium]